MAPPTESSIITKLETSDSPDIYGLVSNYLHPFSEVNSSSSNHNQTIIIIRQLAKRFISFINTSLSILPKRLKEISKSSNELFKTYILCLDCLELVFPQLDSNPLVIHFQRLRLVRCFEFRHRFCEAEAEAFKLLERLPGAKRKKKMILPEIGKSSCDDDKDLFVLIVEIVATLVRCASMASDKEDDGYFRRVLQLMDEVRPWLRYVGQCCFFFPLYFICCLILPQVLNARKKYLIRFI
jgi:separase